MATALLIIAIIMMAIIWVVSSQRRLVVLDENVSNAMCQIGVQLSCRFDALTALLDLTKGYAENESEKLIEAIKSRRSMITAKSTPDDVLRQDGIISETLDRLAMVTEQYPELKAEKSYIQTMNAVDTYENMMRTSRLIYNNSVTKLNREIRMFPISLIAGILGFQKRDYLEDKSAKANLSNTK
jgi:LemA protein